MKHKPLIYWGLCVLTLAYLGGYQDLYFFYNHSDTGWELYSIWQAMHGGPLDFLMTIRFGYLPNVPAMWLFGINLWAIRLYTLFFMFLASWWFCYTMTDKASRHLVPLGIITILLTQFYFTDYIFNYYLSITFFLLLSITAWLRARDTPGHYGLRFTIIAAVAMACASAANIGVAPAGLVALIILMFGLPKSLRWWLLAIGTTSFMLIWAVYLYAYHVPQQWHAASQFSAFNAKAQHAHAYDFAKIISAVSSFSVLLFSGIICAYLLVRFFISKTHTNIRYAIVCLVILLTCIYQPYVSFVNVLGVQYNTIMYQYIFITTLVISLTFFTYWKDVAKNRRMTFILIQLVVLAFYSAHRSTSDNFLPTIFMLYIGIAVTTMMLTCSPQIKEKWSRLGFISLTLYLGIITPTLLNIDTIQGIGLAPIWRSTVKAPYSTMVPKQTAEIYNNLRKQYRLNHCNKAFFFSFYDVSIPYILFHRHAPYNQSWVSQNDFYPTNNALNTHTLVRLLNHQKHWCVVYSNVGAGDGVKYNKNYLKNVLEYLQLYSRNVTMLGYQPIRKKYYWLYTK